MFIITGEKPTVHCKHVLSCKHLVLPQQKEDVKHYHEALK